MVTTVKIFTPIVLGKGPRVQRVGWMIDRAQGSGVMSTSEASL